MIVSNVKDVPVIEVSSPLAKNASMKALVSDKEGWEGYVMREVEVLEGGFTPKHTHPWEHINYMLEGEGELVIDGKINKVTKGSFAFVPPGSLHQFRNAGKGTFKFICIVPKQGHVY